MEQQQQQQKSQIRTI